MTIETRGGSILTILPSKQCRVSVTCVGPENRITQYFDAVITPETYEKELAPARTFTFYEDIKPLLEKGLIKGGSLENAVVIRGEELMSKEPMRFINEFARHKAMDLIGDLSLCGKPILGHVIAIKPGTARIRNSPPNSRRSTSAIFSLCPTPSTCRMGTPCWTSMK